MNHNSRSGILSILNVLARSLPGVGRIPRRGRPGQKTRVLVRRLPMVVEEGGPGTGGVRSNLGSSRQGNFPSSVLHSVRRCGVGNVIEREECEHIRETSRLQSI
jgi:hypothetical protein